MIKNIGLANRNKGARFEREVASYCRAHSMPGADRKVVTGWRAGERSSADAGDIRGIPGVCLQAKNVVKQYPRGLAGKALLGIMAETAAQAEEMGAAIWLIVEKRAGHLIGECWVHMPANTFAALVFGIDPFSPQWAEIVWPVRIEFSRIVDKLAAFSATCAEVAA